MSLKPIRLEYFVLHEEDLREVQYKRKITQEQFKHISFILTDILMQDWKLCLTSAIKEFEAQELRQKKEV